MAIIITNPDFVARAARGLRGRFGTDVWQAWSNMGIHEQQDWCHNWEPSASAIDLRKALIGILHAEGIKRTIEANCCSACESPIICTA